MQGPHEPSDGRPGRGPIDPTDPLPTGALATFVATHHAGSISAAASRLHLSQPAVSRRLQGLERHLGVPLFDRLPGGLRTTAAGLALLPHAERALAAEADAVRAAVGRRDLAAGPVAVGAVGSLVEPYLTSALRAVVERHPRIDIEIATATSAELGDLIRRGELAVGVSYAQGDDPDLTVRVLATERLVAACAPDHPLAGRRLDGSELRRHRWLVFPDHDAHPETSGTIARRLLERHHVPAHHLRPIDSLSAQRALAMAGYGLALLPVSMVGADLARGGLATVEAPSLAVTTPVTVITRRHAHIDPATSTVIDVLLGGPDGGGASG